MDAYEKKDFIDSGAMGRVWVMVRKCDGKRVAGKEVDFRRRSRECAPMLRREAQILASLSHPNIVRYIDCIEERPYMYIIMELCDGGDLCNKCTEYRELNRPFPEALLVWYCAQLCLALAYLHSHDVMHRDIKTQNVFLTENDIVKLGDFGVSRELRASLERATTITGTKAYHSPELCQNLPYDHKSDIWSLGVLLYECANGGDWPFSSGDDAKLKSLIISGSYAPLSDDYSDDYRAVVDWCLQKDPTKRPLAKQLLQLPLLKSALQEKNIDAGRINELTYGTPTPCCDFFLGKVVAAPSNEKVDDVLRLCEAAELDVASLQTQHSYHQWLFPTETIGAYPEAPLLQVNDSEKLAGSPAAMANAMRGLKGVLRFSGARLSFAGGLATNGRGEEVCRLTDASLARWDDSPTPFANLLAEKWNNLRITRMLLFLSRINADSLQLKLAYFLADEVFGGDKPLAACADSFTGFWVKALNDPADQQRLQHYADALARGELPEKPPSVTGPFSTPLDVAPTFYPQHLP